MNKIIGFLLALLICSNSVFAADFNCGSIENCKIMGKKVDERLAEILRTQTKFLPVPKGTYQKLRMFTYPEVVNYCNSQQAHVATARELARFMMNNGARGILELTEAKPNASTLLITSYSSTGAPDFFYFDNTGLKPREQLPYSKFNFVPEHLHRGYTSRGYYEMWDNGWWQIISPRVAMYDTPDFNALCVKNELPGDLNPSLICSDQLACNGLREKIGIRLTQLQSQVSRRFILGPKNTYGTLKQMTLAEGLNYCLDKGAHLSTAREMVAYISENFVRDLKTFELYIRSDKRAYVRTIEIDGKNDGFYYGGDMSHTEYGYYLTSSRDGANQSSFLDDKEIPTEYWHVLSLNSQDVRILSVTFNDGISGGVVCVK